MKQFTCLYYWLVDPTIIFKDTSDKKPCFEIPIVSDLGEFKFALFLSKNNIPEYGRLSIFNLSQDKIPDDLIPIIQGVKEHFLSIIRVTYNDEVTLFPFPFWTFVKDISSFSFGLVIQNASNYNFDVERAKRFFIGSFNYRDELRLFIEGNDKRIPLQYRYLSMYKIIELEFKKQGDLQTSKLEAFLHNYESRFLELNIQKKPKDYIILLRDKCAHIKTGKKVELLGVTQLNHKESVKISRIMPVMSDICIDILNARANGDYVIEKRNPEKSIHPIASSEFFES